MWTNILLTCTFLLRCAVTSKISDQIVLCYMEKLSDLQKNLPKRRDLCVYRSFPKDGNVVMKNWNTIPNYILFGIDLALVSSIYHYCVIFFSYKSTSCPGVTMFHAFYRSFIVLLLACCSFVIIGGLIFYNFR